MYRRTFLTGAALLCASAQAGIVSGKPREELIDSFARKENFQGVVLIGKAGKPIYLRTVGFADIEAQKPAKLETPYPIASISKWLTSLALLKLQEAGRIDLEAPLTRYLKTYRADTGDKVRLRHLMTNISGIPNGFAPLLKTNPGAMQIDISTGEAVQRYCSGDLKFAPGTAFDYTPTNWMLLIAVIEAVTGKPYAAVMAEMVSGPLGLKHTTTVLPADAAIGYRSISPLQRQTMEEIAPYFMASGGFISTAGDLLSAAHQVFDGGFLAPASKRALITVGWAEESYALGGRVKSLFVDGMPRVFAWETGRTFGYRSVVGHRFDDQTTVVVLNNTSVSQRAMDEFAYSLFGQM
ncbi:CubicO group peptidase (beta-lactamase class C family) [Rhizomicrobium palustre]|uniref:CubicO group peptidase (Beta-lactamase class C family) n=1 Tax=Rhizomicrobium palustre TaxID=189966 RepID=A0A846N5Y5_9PROT|nr:serine hydrolase domain-containing protein [Rhizomicrobium palustre]NIK90400.1 CubicO group peptidase (beta-lactamase class C family) [Rhizomicrobium palustre]